MYSNRLALLIRSLRPSLVVGKPLYIKSVPSSVRFNSVSHTKSTGNKQEELLEEAAEEEDEEVVAPDLQHIENRWTKLKQDDQYEVIDYLKDQQELTWRDLSTDEKKLAYFLAYGEWGPRDKAPISLPESIFRLMSTSLLFIVSGFSLVNYFNDKEKVKSLEAGDL